VFTFGRTALKNGCIDRAIRNKINAALLQHRIINKVKKFADACRIAKRRSPLLCATAAFAAKPQAPLTDHCFR